MTSEYRINLTAQGTLPGSIRLYGTDADTAWYADRGYAIPRNKDAPGDPDNPIYQSYPYLYPVPVNDKLFHSPYGQPYTSWFKASRVYGETAIDGFTIYLRIALIPIDQG